MAKTRAPLLSVAASGSIANVLIMSRGRRQPYAKYSRKPKDPKTAKQLARREWFRILTSIWNHVSPYQQGTWEPLLKPGEDNLKFAYMRGNLAYIDRGEWPSPEYPATRNLTAANMDPLIRTGGPRHVALSEALTTLSYNWLLVFSRTDHQPYDTTPQTTVRVIEATTSLPPGPYKWIDAPLEPGTYYYKINTISMDGKVRYKTVYYWAIVT